MACETRRLTSVELEVEEKKLPASTRRSKGGPWEMNQDQKAMETRGEGDLGIKKVRASEGKYGNARRNKKAEPNPPCNGTAVKRQRGEEDNPGSADRKKIFEATNRSHQSCSENERSINWMT